MLLLFEAQERLEAEFDGFALCLESGSLEDVLHEGIIDDNIGFSWGQESDDVYVLGV